MDMNISFRLSNSLFIADNAATQGVYNNANIKNETALCTENTLGNTEPRLATLPPA